MPIIVPIEENHVGIADLTDEKFRAADYGGSGLEALGAGLAALGGGGEQLATALDEKKRRALAAAVARGQADDRLAAALGEDHQINLDDAAAKKAYVDFSEAAAPLLHGDDGILAHEGVEAHGAFPKVAAGLAHVYDKALAPLTREQRGIVAPALAERLQNYIALSGKHVREQGAVEQRRQSEAFQQATARDAVAHIGNPDLHELYVATGENAIRRQATIEGAPTSEAERRLADYRSQVHGDGIDTLVPRDAVYAAAMLARLRDGMSPAAQARAEAALAPALAQQQAIADVDGLALMGAATAPATPREDRATLRDKMQAITPMMDERALPSLMRRYGDDAARAWAAFQAGRDFVDRLVKQRGDGWYAALPEDARRFVAHNMALLGAVASSRAAPQDVDAAAAAIDAQDWNDARKAGAMRELRYRGHRAAQAQRDGESAATDQAFATAEKLGTEFTSIAQIDPATRRALPSGVVAVLERQADANIHPRPVASEGPVAQQLRMLASGAPEQFARVDLRQYRDLVLPEEYGFFQRVQTGAPVMAHDGDVARRLSSAAGTHSAGVTLASFERPPSDKAEAAGDVASATEGQDDRIPLGSEIGHHPIMPQLDDWITSLSDDVGALARKTESHDDSARISTGKGDAGGPSYGSYQLVQNRGQVPEFLATEGAPWAKELGAAPIYSEQFKSIWQAIARREGQKFKDAENAFARRTKYNPVMRAISEVLDFNLNTRSVAVRGAVTAAANHMGPGGPTHDNGGYGVVRRAIVQTDQSLSRDDSDYDRQLVDNIYGQRKTLLLKMADHLMKKSEDLRLPPDKRAEARAQGINLRRSAQNVFTNEHDRAMAIIASERKRYPSGF